MAKREGKLLGDRWEVGTELSKKETDLANIRVFLARESDVDSTDGPWDKVVKIPESKHFNPLLTKEVEILKAASRKGKTKNLSYLPELWGWGLTEDGLIWLVREGLNQGLTWSTGQEMEETLLDLRLAFAALEELHKIGWVMAGSLGPRSFLRRPWHPKDNLRRDSETLEDVGLIIAQLGGAERIGENGKARLGMETELSRLVGVRSEYWPSHDLMGMILWAALVTGSGIPWSGLEEEETSWIKWVLPPSVLLHRLPPGVQKLWQNLVSLSSPKALDYALAQRLVKDALSSITHKAERSFSQ